jgi:hypothetical protein
MYYRKLNIRKKKDYFSLPQNDNTLDMLEGTKLFSTLDLKSGFWQVDIHLENGVNCILDLARVMAVYSHALCPLQTLQQLSKG